MSDQDFKRKLTAVFSADVAGYSRLMGEDEAATVKTLEAYKQIMFSLIKQHRGRVIDSPGDNLLAEFASVVDAVQCGVAVQKELQSRNADLPETRKMRFRIGINLGDVIEEGNRIYGDGVNIAARLESCADPGGICISKTAFDQIETKLPLGYEFLGEKEVKNIAKPVGAYRVLMEPRVTMAGAKTPKIPLWRKKSALAGAAAVLIVIVGVAIWTFYGQVPKIEPASKEKMAFPLPDKPSIAVMPFLNMSGDKAQDPFCDGLSESIITALAKTPQLFVIGRDTTFSYKGKTPKAKEVSEELGVQYVLEGSIQRSGDRVRVTAQLIDALKGHHLWADRYDREMKDLFAVLDEITLKIITGLNIKLTHGESARIVARGTENLDAYLKAQEAGWYSGQSTRESLDRARRLSEEAIALDPKFPLPYTILGIVHMVQAFTGFSQNPKESMELANKMQRKAIELDESFAFARAVLAWNLAMLRKFDEALSEVEKACQLAPGNSSVLYWYGTVLAFLGRAEEALPVLKEVLRLEPKPSNSRLRSLGMALRDTGRYEEAIAVYGKATQREPDDIIAQISLTSTCSMAGRDEEARIAAIEVLRINPKFSVERFMRTMPYKDPAARERVAKALIKAGLPETPPLSLPDKPSIAVLPFVNMSDDKSQEYFSDGLTEEIITALSKTPKLFVIARNSSFAYKGKSVDMKQVSRELGVKYVLEGSVRRSGNQLRITAQLIDATTGNHLWSERYERSMADLFAIQDDITLAIVKALRMNLTAGEQARLTGRGTKNLDAYLKTIEATEQFFLMNRQGSLKAKEFAREAITLDPKYAFPHAILANAHMLDAWFRFSESYEHSMKLAEKAAHKALELDENDPSIHSTMTNLYVMQRQYDKALAAAERALALGPGSARSQSSMGTALNFSCRFKEAIPFFEEAIRMDPYPPGSSFRALGSAYNAVGRHEEALKAYEKALRINPNDIFAHLSLAALYIELGREEDARAEASEVLRLHPKFSLDYFSKTLTYKDQSVIDRRIDLLRKAGLK